MTKPIRILSSPDCHSIYSTHIMIVGIAQPCHVSTQILAPQLPPSPIKIVEMCVVNGMLVHV